jgi:hypothetical protein
MINCNVKKADVTYFKISWHFLGRPEENDKNPQ